MTQTVPNLASASPATASPCIGICELDAEAGRCRGCARTGDEIARWRDAPDSWRAAVWAELPARIADMGLNIRRLSWSPPEILAFVEDSLRAGRGVWRFGVYGAVAEVAGAPGEPIEIRRDAACVEAVTPRAALRIRAVRGLRALGWRETGGAPERIVLATPRVRLGAPGPAAPTALGPDDEALLPGGAGRPRVDVGLGRAEARLSVRGDALEQGDVLAAAGDRIIETPVGRVELAATPEGAPVRLDRDRLAENRAVAPTLRLPAAYAAGCVFYPHG